MSDLGERMVIEVGGWDAWYAVVLAVLGGSGDNR
jgi:hypothetical protein